jgi:hypothetical protein
MRQETSTTVENTPVQNPTIRFRVADVTGNREMEVEVAVDAPAGAVAKQVAEQMQLPGNVPWGLRDDRGGFLDDARQIGEQVSNEGQARVGIVPKTHLG